MGPSPSRRARRRAAIARTRRSGPPTSAAAALTVAPPSATCSCRARSRGASRTTSTLLEEAKAPVMDVAGAVPPAPKAALKASVAKRANVASFYHNWGVPAPSQGFEGDDVEHEDYESTTKDWGKEYGP